MKKLLILFFLALTLMTACESVKIDQSQGSIYDSYYDLHALMWENQQLKNNLSYLNAELEEKDKTIGLLEERLSNYYDGPISRASPSNHISGEDIYVKGDKVLIDLKGAVISSVTDTHSMEPFVDKNSNLIEVKPESYQDIKLGDLVAYRSEFVNGTIVHRVVSVGKDEQGWFATLKGDNNPLPDPGKVRFSQIETVVIGIVY